MAFRNLEERFQQKMDEIYDRYSAKVGRNGQLLDEPYLEVKPNDENLPKLQYDSRMVPGQAFELDKLRMDAFLNSPKGFLWVTNQRTLQKMNIYSETREFDVSSFTKSLEPNVHIRRSTNESKLVALLGDVENRSPESVGSSGRLQLQTSQDAISRLSVSRNPVIRASGEFNVPILRNETGEVGLLGVGQRPELNIKNDGKYDSLYSVALWKGQRKLIDGPTESALKRLSNAVKSGQPVSALGAVGQIAGRVTSVAGSVQNNLNRVERFVDTVGSFAKTVGNPVARRERGIVDLIGDGFGLLTQAKGIKLGTDNTDRPEGTRYFITGPKSADRYIPGSIDYNGSKPTVSLSFMNRYPVLYQDPILGIENVQPRGARPVYGETADLGEAVVTANAPSGIIQTITKGVRWASNTIGKITKIGNDVSRAVTDIQRRSIEDIENPAEDAMKFSGLSVRQKYLTDQKMAYMRDQLDTQKEKWLESIKTTYEVDYTSYRGGISPGKPTDPKYNEKYKFNGIDFSVAADGSISRRYFSDVVNSSNNTLLSDSDTGVSPKQLKELNTGLINFYFFDVYNKKSIPLRAYLKNFNQRVTPTYIEIPYLGRIERNIIYTGFKRDLSFSIQLYAMSQEELDVIWNKANYLISMTAPATYDTNGFMVPPLTKLTVGSLFVNQPGFIRSLDVVVEDDTPWEIDYDRQLPLGVLINVTYGIIETHQMKTGLYDIGSGHSETRFVAPLMGNNTSPVDTNQFGPPPDFSNMIDPSTIPGITPGANRTTTLNSSDVIIPADPTPQATNIRNTIVKGANIPQSVIKNIGTNIPRTVADNTRVVTPTSTFDPMRFLR